MSDDRAQTDATWAGENPAESIYRALYDGILSRALPPGTKLTETVIADSFGVSRTVLRPVLQRLEHDGVVENFARRGSYVAQPDVEATKNVFAARRVIEAGILSQLGDAISADEVARLEHWIVAEDAARRAGDEKELLRVSGDFHMALAELGGNPLLLSILRDLIGRSVLATAIYQRSSSVGCRTDHHRAILKLLQKGQNAKAARSMIEHLTSTERDLDFSPRRGQPVDLRNTMDALRPGRPVGGHPA